MRRATRLCPALVALNSALVFTTSAFGAEALTARTAALTAEILQHGQSYTNLGELTKMGPRLAGSPGAEHAVAWAKAKMESYGLRVSLVPAVIPLWTRGAVERAVLSEGGLATDLKLTALGGSIATPPGGLDGEVVEVQSLAQVEQMGKAVAGKIVFYNRPMDPALEDKFKAYGGAIDQRTAGASQAARFGAIAVVVRSLSTLPDDDHPHTGAVGYRIDAARIPAAALSTHAANVLALRLKANPKAKLHLELSGASHGMGTGYNVVGDLVGATLPDEVVLVSGHLDSWDLGPGAHDDGAGVVQALEAVRAIKALQLKPKRTVRVVLWTAEEEGGFGARDYAAAMKKAGVRHIAAIESDCGGFAPLGFSTDAGPQALAQLQGWKAFFEPLHATKAVSGHSGTDVEPLAAPGVATVGLMPVSTHYFDLHHSALDQLSAVEPASLLSGAAALAVLSYLYAEEGTSSATAAPKTP